VETGDAIVARRRIRTKYLEVSKGETCGLHQHAKAKMDGKVCLSLDLKMYLDAENPHDAIQIEGTRRSTCSLRWCSGRPSYCGGVGQHRGARTPGAAGFAVDDGVSSAVLCLSMWSHE